ncbi:metal ABC transporter permease [Candidatus Tisiphia endosymbiont of Nemotelus uliginosus]|uniref:metal ABC transporter permease n=1 Tax=Candidatus Tisiphia endosymbiont of Nemotelus uliginosus TaxID=3077926 RepID=UPI0035C899F2
MFLIILTIILISLIFAPLGCISLWKKYVYFGDGLAHASLLAGSISIICHFSVISSGVIVAILFAILVFILNNKAVGSSVVILVSSFMLSLALVISYLKPAQININNLLFGDILAASFNDIGILLLLLILVVSFIWYFYDQILLIVINKDIAKIKGINVRIIELVFLIFLSLAIFSTIKIVGSLLVTSILLIPAMTSRLISRTPGRMIINAAIISLAINFIGLISSFHFDIPLTPIITLINTIIYSLIYSISYVKKILL